MEPTDLELLQRIADRDAEAFAAFYDRHAPLVLGLIRRQIPGAIEADDVLQEVFWQVWECADRYDPSRSSVRGWLALLTRSRAIDYRRRNPVPSHPDSNDPRTIEVDPSHQLVDQEAHNHLSVALKALSADQSQVVKLAFFDGLTHHQISERLNLPLGTVKTRIRAGLAKLRGLLNSGSDPVT